MVAAGLLRRIAAYGTTAVMAGFGLTGVVSAQTITNTGPGSTNNITSNATNNCSVHNSNNLSVSNHSSQTAVTGDATDSGNTSSGLSWAGWSGLDPNTAQAAGQSYNAWWSGVVNWIAQRASGNGWNSNSTNLSWTPGSASWNAWDPMSWQANGQSFANWYTSVESYLNSNSAAWVLSWPADATGGSSMGGATTGNATNNNSASFSININNAARAMAGTNSCGQSLFTPPPTGGGGGSSGGGGAVLGASTFSSRLGGGGGGVGGYGSAGFFPASYSVHAPAPKVASAPAVTNTPSTPSVPVVVPPVPPAPENSISNTGPDSSNNITTNQTDNSSVCNNNNVSVSNSSTQTATSGDASVTSNTSSGGAGSGGASNGNGTGGAVGVNN